jgi:hypothetical protein
MGSRRRILAGLFWTLACLAFMLSTVTVWAHRSVLTTDGWSRLTSQVFSDPEVIQGTSVTLAERLTTAVGLEERVANVLPGVTSLLAGMVTGRVEDWLAGAIADVMAREKVQEALVAGNRAAHEAAMAAIRGGDEALASEQGVITLNVFPLIEGALVRLQESGFLPADLQIPDLSEYQVPEQTVSRLEGLLGRDLPDDLGTITLVQSDRLAGVQQAVRLFDLLTLGLVAVTLVLMVLAVWLSARRLRMVMWLAIGSAVALLLGRLVTRFVVTDISGSLADGPSGQTVRGVIEASVNQVMWFSFGVIVLALVVAGLAFVFDRQAEADARGATAPRLSVGGWLHANSRIIGYIGLGIIGFIVLWRVAGPDIALLAAAGVGLWLIAMGVLGSGGEAAGGGTSEAGAPAGSGG